MRFTLFVPLRDANLTFEQNNSFYREATTVYGEARKGGAVQHDYEVEQEVLCSDRIVLDCSCGETLILLGHEQDWYVEGRTTFGCHQCGGTVSLPSFTSASDEGREPGFIGDSDGRGIDEEGMSVRELIRSLRTDGR